jgi:hypothetical protein
MKVFRCFLLLATSAVLGLALAIWIALVTDSSAANGNPFGCLDRPTTTPGGLPSASSRPARLGRAESSTNDGPADFPEATVKEFVPRIAFSVQHVARPAPLPSRVQFVAKGPENSLKNGLPKVELNEPSSVSQ